MDAGQARPASSDINDQKCVFIEYKLYSFSGESAGASAAMLVLHHPLARDKIDSVLFSLFIIIVCIKYASYENCIKI